MDITTDKVLPEGGLAMSYPFTCPICAKKMACVYLFKHLLECEHEHEPNFPFEPVLMRYSEILCRTIQADSTIEALIKKRSYGNWTNVLRYFNLEPCEEVLCCLIPETEECKRKAMLGDAMLKLHVLETLVAESKSAKIGALNRALSLMVSNATLAITILGILCESDAKLLSALGHHSLATIFEALYSLSAVVEGNRRALVHDLGNRSGVKFTI
jgi:hypothetical protein